MFLFRRVVGLDRFSEGGDCGFEVLVGGLATLRGEVLAEARGFIVGDVFAGEFGAENGGRGGGGLGRLPGGGEGCKGMVGLAGAREDAGVNNGVVLRLREV